MIGTNSTQVEKALDGVRERRQKFICLNDNIDHSNPESVNVVRVLHNFYESLYPLPSSFELPENESNPFLYIQDYLAAYEILINFNVLFVEKKQNIRMMLEMTIDIQ